MKYIRYGPWGQPHPQKREIAEYLKNNIFNTLDMAPGVNPTPQKWES
jgi:hypothetical protein